MGGSCVLEFGPLVKIESFVFWNLEMDSSFTSRFQIDDFKCVHPFCHSMVITFSKVLMGKESSEASPTECMNFVSIKNRRPKSGAVY